MHSQEHRLEAVFAQNKRAGRHTLIGYLTAGDPRCPDTVELAFKMKDAGVDIVELGVPYSDPLADGPVLQEAATRALSAGVTPDRVLAMAAAIQSRSDLPVVLLVYYNTVHHYGLESFAKAAEAAGVDGLVIPDLPLEERAPLMEVLGPVALIPLVALSSGSRIPAILEGARGFVYCVSSRGVTGERDTFGQEVPAFLEEVRRHTELPLAVGFGISRREHVELFAHLADGVIVGTALMKKASLHPEDPGEVLRYIREELR